MTVPQLLLVLGQSTETLLADDVLNPDQTRIRGIAIKNHTLMQIMPQMDTKMRRLHLPTYLIGIHGKTIEIRTHRIQRILRLHNTGRHIQHTMLERIPLTDPTKPPHRTSEHHTGRTSHPRSHTTTIRPEPTHCHLRTACS